MSQDTFLKPYANYIEAWTTFRSASDENKVISQWLLSQDAWPTNAMFTLTDFGCGDGRVAAEVVQSCAKRGIHATAIKLIDPDEGFLKSAHRHVDDIIKRACDIRQFPCSIGQQKTTTSGATSQCFDSSVLLLIHVVYLMQTKDLIKFLKRLKPGIPLYVILDNPNSVFSQLWKKTAPMYLDRVKAAHKSINSLPKKDYSVTRSGPGDLVSRFSKTALTDHLTGQLLVSMLCYNDTVDMKEAEFKKFFWKVVNKHTSNGKVRCQSVGYQIVKTAK